MIGDSLFDCGESLDHYLANYEWPEAVATRVRQLREEIREVQQWLDASGREALGSVRLSRQGVAMLVKRGVIPSR